MSIHISQRHVVAAMTVLITAVPTFAAELHVPAQFATIQAAIDAANNADEIIVADGVYAEAIDFTGKMISVRSVNGPDTTTVNAFGLNAPVVTMIGVPAGAELTGFTLTGGNGLNSKFSNLGGGMYMENSSPIVRDCVLRDLTVNGFGAGAYVSGGSPAFVLCTFLKNIATQQAGGMYVVDSELTLSHCRFLGNIGDLGGGILSLSTELNIINCLFSGNGDISTSNGGGLYTNNSTVSILSSTIANNNAVNGRGLASVSSSVDIVNSIIWGSQLNQVSQGLSSVSIRHSNVRGSGGSGASWNASIGVDAGDNLDLDPRFRIPGGLDAVFGTSDDDLTLFDYSPCIDRGDSTALSLDSFDLDEDGDTTESSPLDSGGQPRLYDDTSVSNYVGLLDIGAYERQAPSDTQIHVPQEISSMQLAVDLALEGMEIIIAPGEYNESIQINNKSIIIRGAAGMEHTILNGEGLGTALLQVEGLLSKNSVVEGITFEYGEGWDLTGFGFRRGGAAYLDEVGITFRNCRFQRNRALEGGAIYVSFSTTDLIIEDCQFIENQALNESASLGLDGGAIFVNTGSLKIRRSSFIRNTATGFGGAIVVRRAPNITGNASMNITDCEFLQNSAFELAGAVSLEHDTYFNPGLHSSIVRCRFEGNTSGRGGALSAAIDRFGSSIRITDCEFVANRSVDGPFSTNRGGAANVAGRDIWFQNCAFIGNYATDFGGALASQTRRLRVVNCVMIENHTEELGQAIYISSSALPAPTFTNSTIWSSLSSKNDTQVEYSFDTPNLQITHSNIHGSSGSGMSWNADLGVDLGGNIDADPLFRDPIGPDGIPGTGDEDYELMPGSPCIDAGANDLVAPDFFDLDNDGDTDEPIPFDFRGLPRFIDDPGTPDSGAGVAPIVDIGPYEFQGVSVLADMNGDGAVNGDDLATLLSLWGLCPEGGSCRADLNGDSAVNGTDLAILIASWN